MHAQILGTNENVLCVHVEHKNHVTSNNEVYYVQAHYNDDKFD